MNVIIKRIHLFLLLAIVLSIGGVLLQMVLECEHGHHIYLVDSDNLRIVRMDDIAGTNWISVGDNNTDTRSHINIHLGNPKNVDEHRTLPNGPTGVAIGPDNKIYVADPYSKCIIRLASMDHPYCRVLRIIDINPDPSDRIAIDRKGKIYLTDSANNRIVRVNGISGDGRVTLGQAGSGPQQFSQPDGITIGPRGKIYVADVGNDRIVCMNDMTGAGWVSLAAAPDGVTKFHHPSSIAFGPDGKMYVTDTGNCRVVCVNDMTGVGWTTFGHPIITTTTQIGISQDIGELDRPDGIAVDTEGKIYVTDVGTNEVVRFDNMTGANLIRIGGQLPSSRFTDQLKNPVDIVIH